jgi:uncharacterized membrane protein
VFLVLFALKNRSLPGFLVGLLGADLVCRGATGNCQVYEWIGRSTATGASTPGIRVEKTITVNRRPEEVYSFWRNLENLPTFMKHVQSVSVDGQGRSHWVVHLSPGMTLEWDAEITAERPGELINGSRCRMPPCSTAAPFAFPLRPESGAPK